MYGGIRLATGVMQFVSLPSEDRHPSGYLTGNLMLSLWHSRTLPRSRWEWEWESGGGSRSISTEFYIKPAVMIDEAQRPGQPPMAWPPRGTSSSVIGIWNWELGPRCEDVMSGGREGGRGIGYNGTPTDVYFVSHLRHLGPTQTTYSSNIYVGLIEEGGE